jgi:hypothetical protein
MVRLRRRNNIQVQREDPIWAVHFTFNVNLLQMIVQMRYVLAH